MLRSLAVVLVVAALASTGVASAASSGLKGVVRRGPTQPVCRVGESCSAPAKYLKLVFTRGSRRFSTTTDAVGHYRIALVPGRYTVVIAGQHFGYMPRTAVVLSGRFRVVNVAIDTGIR